MQKKNDAQISGFSLVKKASSPSKKLFLEKKYFHFIFANKINGSRDI